MPWSRSVIEFAYVVRNMFDHLRQHKLMSSGGFKEVKDAVSRCLWPHHMNMPTGESLNSELYGVFFGDAALFDLHYGASVEIDAGDIERFYLVRITLEGGGLIRLGQHSAVLRRGSLTVSSPSQHSYIRTDRDCRSLILRVAREAMERQLQHLLDRPLNRPLVFDISVEADHPGLRVISQTLDYICGLCQHGEPDRQPAVFGTALSDYLVSVLLTQLPHNYHAELHDERRRPLPGHVRRVRDYIEAHLEQPLPLAQLAEVGGVSVRTLQNGFARFLGQSPSDYLRNRRLARVHAALQQARACDSVTDILLRHGIGSFGHFAVLYRKRYGCLPSQTLRRGAA